ncbi:hypothetical protein C8Q77DRAFT_752019 [Trametes polyzona]|nr:hypothetical protein C8Q77DRAFT_752019 [Trametes polyzona]
MHLYSPDYHAPPPCPVVCLPRQVPSLHISPDYAIRVRYMAHRRPSTDGTRRVPGRPATRHPNTTSFRGARTGSGYVPGSGTTPVSAVACSRDGRRASCTKRQRPGAPTRSSNPRSPAARDRADPASGRVAVRRLAVRCFTVHTPRVRPCRASSLRRTWPLLRRPGKGGRRESLCLQGYIRCVDRARTSPVPLAPAPVFSSFSFSSSPSPVVCVPRFHGTTSAGRTVDGGSRADGGRGRGEVLCWRRPCRGRLRPRLYENNWTAKSHAVGVRDRGAVVACKQPEHSRGATSGLQRAL